jgi:hypothetical protein
MPTTLAASAHSTVPGDLVPLLTSWRRHLAAQRMSPATLTTYSASVNHNDPRVGTQAAPPTVDVGSEEIPDPGSRIS